MSLIDDLKGLDLSSIKGARGNITASVSGGDIQGLISGGATQSILGELGSSIEAVTGSFSHPEDLIKPLMDGLSGLTGSMKTDAVPISDFVKVVGQGVGSIVTLLEHTQLDSSGVAGLVETFLGQAVSRFPSQAGSSLRVGLGDLEDLIKVIETVESGIPADAAAFVDLTMTVLVPTGGQGLADLRGSVTNLLQGSGAIQLQATRSQGLLDAMAAISTAADSGDMPGVQSALANLQTVRQHTLDMISADLLVAAGAVNKLPIDSVLAEVAKIGQALSAVDHGVLEYMHKIHDQLDIMRKEIESMDPSQVSARIEAILDQVEATMKQLIVDPIEALAQHAVDWMTGLLSHLPIGEVRDAITNFINAINDAIKSANLDQYANDVRDALNKVQSIVGANGLGAQIQQAITKVEQTISNALDPIIAALTTISTAINTVAGEAKTILEKVADALETFKKAVDEITANVQNLGIDQAGQQIGDTLDKLKQTAQQILGGGSLPDSIKPIVQQAISAIQSVDLDAVMAPIKDAANQIQLPADVGAAINDGIATASDAVKHLIPTALITDIEQEITSTLDTIKNFNPASLLPDISQYLNQAADKIQQLDPSGLIGQFHPEFQKVLDAIDAANPNILLDPVIKAYDSAISVIKLPSAGDALGSLFSGASSSGGQATQGLSSQMGAVMAPGAQANAPAATPPASPPASGSGGGGGAAPPPPPVPDNTPVKDLRPGDLIRVFGYVPSRLREVVATMDQSVVGDVLARIDAVTGGLANDLRLIQATLWNIEEELQAGLDAILVPLHVAQFKAQASLQAHAGVPGFDANASLNLVAQCSPEAIRKSLTDPLTKVLDLVRSAGHQAGGSAGTALTQTADALDGLHLSGVGNSLDNLLAALDPEPIALEMDELIHDIMLKAPDLLTAVMTELKSAIKRLTSLISDFNPGRQLQRFTRVVDALQAQLNILNPRFLAVELGDVHATIRAAVAAYDPAVFAQEISATVTAVANGIRGLNPATLLGNINILTDAVNKVENALPSKVLDGVGAELTDVGNRLLAVKPDDLISAINQVPAELVDAFEQAIKVVKDDIVALLNSLQYSSTSASGSLSVSAAAA